MSVSVPMHLSSSNQILPEPDKGQQKLILAKQNEQSTKTTLFHLTLNLFSFYEVRTLFSMLVQSSSFSLPTKLKQKAVQNIWTRQEFNTWSNQNAEKKCACADSWPVHFYNHHWVRQWKEGWRQDVWGKHEIFLLKNPNFIFSFKIMWSIWDSVIIIFIINNVKLYSYAIYRACMGRISHFWFANNMAFVSIKNQFELK